MAGMDHETGEVGGGSVLKRYLPLIVVAAVAILVISQGWHKYLSLEQIAANRDLLSNFVAENFVLALAIYAALYVVIIALSLPGGALLTITGGFLFGWLTSGVVTVFAATAGATLIFMIAKTSFGETLASRAGPWLQKLRRGFSEDALHYLLFLRLVPAFPFWLINIAPALLGVTLPVFVIGTFVGIIPGTFAFSYLGYGLDSIIEKQKQIFIACEQAGGTEPCTFTLDPAALLTPQLLGAFAALGVVAILPVIIKKLRKRNVAK